MKTLIFDIDDTLIKWQDEFIGALKHVLKEMHYNFSEELILKIDSAINEHEHHYPKLILLIQHVILIFPKILLIN